MPVYHFCISILGRFKSYVNQHVFVPFGELSWKDPLVTSRAMEEYAPMISPKKTPPIFEGHFLRIQNYYMPHPPTKR